MSARFSPALNALLVLAVAFFLAAPAPYIAPLRVGCESGRLKDMVGQMIMVGFPGDDENDEGVRAVRAQLNEGTIGGVVLFPANINGASRSNISSPFCAMRAQTLGPSSP